MARFERLRDEARAEDGLTLIELLISLGLLAIVIGPITFGFLLGLLETTAAHERIADASSAQVISSFLLADVESSQEVRDSVTQRDAGEPCQPAGDLKVELEWTEPKDGANVVASYVSRPEDGQDQLYRIECTGGVLADPLLLVLNLNADDPVIVTCERDGSAVGCPDDPESVAVHFSANSVEPDQDATDGDVSSYDPFTFDFEARRRVGS